MTASHLARWNDPDAMTAVQRIALNLDAQFDAADPYAVAVVSARNGEGRSHTAASLAVAYARMGRRCLLLDGDLQAPVLHEWFGLTPGGGVHEWLTAFAETADGGEGESESPPPPTDAVAEHVGAMLGEAVVEVPGLRVMGAGRLGQGTTLALWRPAILGPALRQCFDQADVVVIDTPQALRHADAQVIAPQVSACLLVGRKGLSYLAEMQAVRDQLSTAGARLAGSVMNTQPVRTSLWAALSPRPTRLP